MENKGKTWIWYKGELEKAIQTGTKEDIVNVLHKKFKEIEAKDRRLTKDFVGHCIVTLPFLTENEFLDATEEYLDGTKDLGEYLLKRLDKIGGTYEKSRDKSSG